MDPRSRNNESWESQYFSSHGDHVMAIAHDLAIFKKSLRAVLYPQMNTNSQPCDVSPYTNSYHYSRLKLFIF